MLNPHKLHAQISPTPTFHSITGFPVLVGPGRRPTGPVGPARAPAAAPAHPSPPPQRSRESSAARTSKQNYGLPPSGCAK